jgi:serine/threonine protein kinase
MGGRQDVGMDSWALCEGDTIAGGRHVLRHLGGGRRHEVYLAWDDRLRATVVTKLLRPDLVEDERALTALAAEAGLLDRLAHPSLLRGFGARLDGPCPHLVLEHIEGPRLSTVIRRDVIALEQLLPLALNVAGVLHYLRAEDVVHLDVKPGNIILGGPPRLIDLSVARPLAAPVPREPVGTDKYMAPEQCDPARFGAIGSPADVWGLGATLHEAIGGEPPFAADGRRFPQLRAAPRPLPRRTPPALAALVAGCLDPDPAARPLPDELADRIEALVAGLPEPRLSRFRPGGAARLRGLERA